MKKKFYVSSYLSYLIEPLRNFSLNPNTRRGTEWKDRNHAIFDWDIAAVLLERGFLRISSVRYLPGTAGMRSAIV